MRRDPSGWVAGGKPRAHSQLAFRAAALRRTTGTVPWVTVPLFDTRTPLEPLKARLNEATARVIESGSFILGPEVEAFEREFASYLGARNAVGVANGTDAITIALRALGVGPGDDVVVPSFTFYASAEAIPPTGARPVFCDVDPDTMMVTPETVKAALTPNTKAVIAVHLFGNVAPVREIEALGVPVVEDSAQAAGSTGPEGRPGALGTIATFSFFPSKNLGCLGDGGAVTTNDDKLADRVRMLRFHGSWDKVTYTHVGYNSRLDELQAAYLRILLPELDGWSDARRAVAQRYADAGLGEHVTLPVVTAGAAPAWHLYVIRREDPDALGAHLAEAGVQNRGYYRTPVHRQPAMLEYAEGVELPATEELARTHLAIPMGSSLTQADTDAVVAAVAGVPVG
jgi:dTDP-3-amino-3,4,6-trideoxy-alpha-D-glucose transaminase